MPAALIKDFLLTQGLKLPLDEVRAAYLTAQTVMDMGMASIDRSVLWRNDEGWKLADYLPCDDVRENALKRLLWLWIRCFHARQVSGARRFMP